MTFVLGVTGSIGMGKSTLARQAKWLGAEVSNADEVVHRLLAQDKAVQQRIAALFPEAMIDGQVNRPALGMAVFGDDSRLKQLEAILHPAVRSEHLWRIRRAISARQPLLVLDIPLLYETGAEQICDAVVVVTAPAFLQRQRVLKRPGMTDVRLQSILARQLPDAEKRRRADFIIHTGLGKASSLRQLRRIMKLL